jgi:hypothetical protein
MHVWRLGLKVSKSYEIVDRVVQIIMVIWIRGFLL